MARAGARGTSAARGGQSPQTRAALVAAAIAALRDVGFAGASAREIARRAACNPALVFYHFGSVTDLLLAALDDVSDRRLAAYRGLLDGPRSLAELIAYNTRETDREMPLFAQELFVNAQAKGSLSSPEYVEAHERSKRLAGAEGIDDLF